MTELALIAKATVILGVALAAVRVARHAPASLRSLILALAFGIVLILPLASALAPTRELPIAGAYAPAFLLEELNPPLRAVSPPAPTPDVPSPREWRLPSFAMVTRAAWLAGALATMGPLLLGLWRLRRIRTCSRIWVDGGELADTLRSSLGVRRGVTVILHDTVAAPMTCGSLRPTIAMPADAPNWPTADVRQALLHELEHVRRCDWPVQVAARITCSLYWFHPAVWIAWRRLRLECERACDDAVVAQAEDVAYAQQLVALARRFGTTPAPLLSMADRRTLATRVAAILDRNVPRGRVGAGYVAAIVVLAAALSAVISPLRAVVRAQAVQESTEMRRAFEVASIRRNTSGQQGQTIALQGNTFVARNVTARELVMTAFRVRAEDLSGGPGWLDSERYDVSGRPQKDATWDEHLVMVQRLLVDRFKLSIRREARPTPVYALVIHRSGPKLTPAADPNCTSSAAAGPKCGGFATRPGFFNGRRVTVAQVASLLSGRSGRLVLDRTGISGFFDVTLTWTPDASQLPPGPPPGDVPPFDPSGPSLFAAIQEQLGLRLEPATADTDHFVIEQIERPTPNDAPELTAPEQPVAVQKPTPSSSPRASAPAFDVTSVRRNTSGDRGARQQFTAGRFAATNTSLRMLLVDAFRIQSFQIVGGPEWLGTARFDIVATIPPDTTPEQRPAMLRTLLAERFTLKAHTERRQMPIYALVANRDDRRLGPDLRKSAMECSAVSKGGPLRAPTTKVQPDGRPECGMMMGPASIRGGGMTMAQFGNALSTYVQRTIVDRTGFEGFYDFDLRYAPRGPGISTEAAAADPRPSIFTAIQEQLGLRLEAETGPVDVLVVDSVDLPTEN